MSFLADAVESAQKALKKKQSGKPIGSEPVDRNEFEQRAREKKHVQQCIEYDTMRTQNTQNATKMEKLKKTLREYAEVRGSTNERGNVEWSRENVSVELQKRGGGSVIDEEAAKRILKEKGLLSRVLKKRTEEYFDETELSKLVLSGAITKKELLSMEIVIPPTIATIIDVKKGKKKNEIESED